jgi:polar amino acid transport system substrate-binding protein
MLQVIQHQKSGEMTVEELPIPVCHQNGILVKTHYSIISAGTEKASVNNTKASLLEKAKKQPEQVKMVLDMVKKEGLISTYHKVQNKLDSYKTMGYSLSGEVIQSNCDEFKIGDLVACAGAGYAVHAEVITVPKNLAVKIPEGVSMEDASFVTLGSIALQGIRQADLRLGETVAVIGLGLLGQLTVQMLKASGCRVIGMDIDEKLFDKAKEYGCEFTFKSDKENLKTIKSFGDGFGVDATIITASTQSNEPVEIALDITRKKGKVIVVGAVGMNLPRSPFYEKEIDFRISCSYGPGRYDADYEEYGNDYPPAYVRWTEKRNLQTILELIANNRLDVKSMVSHKFLINDAIKAYDIITGVDKQPFLGILLEYPANKEIIKSIELKKFTPHDKLQLGFIGAGNFAQSSLLPPLKETGVDFQSVSTATSVNAISVSKIFGFAKATSDSDEIINSKENNLIFIATRHDSHGEYVKKALLAGKPVFVEKPLAVNYEELNEIEKAFLKNNGRLMVGFNRRFSKSFRLINDFFQNRTEPMVISYRVNAGFIPKSHWVYQENQGYGRIIGEACHFIDCMMYLTKAMPIKVYAEAITSENVEVFNNDNVIITIKFSDGSVGTIQYLSNGDTSYSKEFCEVFCGQSVAVMNNYETVELIKNKKKEVIKLDGKKGHKEEVFEFIKAIKEGKPLPISYNELKAVTITTFAANDALAKGVPQGILI